MSDQSSTPDDSVEPVAEETPTPDATASTEMNWLDALREVIDPELMVNIVDLGLIYSVSADEETEQGVAVEMTLTSPACPAGPQIVQQSKMKQQQLAMRQQKIIQLIRELHHRNIMELLIQVTMPSNIKIKVQKKLDL